MIFTWYYNKLWIIFFSVSVVPRRIVSRYQTVWFISLQTIYQSPPLYPSLDLTRIGRIIYIHIQTIYQSPPLYPSLDLTRIGRIIYIYIQTIYQSPPLYPSPDLTRIGRIIYIYIYIQLDLIRYLYLDIISTDDLPISSPLPYICISTSIYLCIYLFFHSYTCLSFYPST